jgi:hypothetical protein
VTGSRWGVHRAFRAIPLIAKPCSAIPEWRVIAKPGMVEIPGEPRN